MVVIGIIAAAQALFTPRGVPLGKVVTGVGGRVFAVLPVIQGSPA
jgi:hypothetical protein